MLQPGTSILYSALDRPIGRLIENAGKDAGEVLAGMTHFAKSSDYKVRRKMLDLM